MEYTERKFHGFTLVELLVVVAIIALLLSILMPSLQGARSQAKASVCGSNLKQLANSNAIYLQQDNVFPPVRLKKVDGVTYINRYGRSQPRWHWFLYQDIQPVIDPEGFSLPFGDSSVSSDGRNGRTMTNPYFLDPEMSGEYARDIRNGPYGYNYQYLGDSRDRTSDTYWNWPVGEGKISAPSSTILFGDSRGGDPNHGLHSYTLDPPKKSISEDGVAVEFGPTAPADGPLGHSPVEMRHKGKGNVVFVDTHVEALELRELGYEVGDDGQAIPIDPFQMPDSQANNRLWTGTAQDQPLPSSE